MSSLSTRGPHVRPIDFRRPSKFTRDQLRQFEYAHGSFCQTASSRMSTELRTEMEMTILNHDQLPYSAVMLEEVPRDALVLILRIQPLGTEICLVLDLQLAMVLVNRFLGGTTLPDPEYTVPGLTDLETVVARRALDTLVTSLSSTWEDLAEVTIETERAETSSASVQLAPAQEPTMLMNLEMQVDGITSIATLVVPHRSVAPLLTRLEQGRYGLSAADDHSRAMMAQILQGVPVEVRVEAGSRTMSLGDVLALKPGDVLPLKRPEERGVTVCIEDQARWIASPGTHGNLRAVELRHREEAA